MALANPVRLPQKNSVASRQGPRLGLLGGTFDPIHIGHLIVAEEACARFGLDRLLFIPAKVPPHKVQGPFASAEDRLRMVQLAIRDNPCFVASCVELERQGPSFTLDTLLAIHQQYGARAELFFVMGTDSLLNLKTWHRAPDIIKLARIIAVRRPGYDVDMEAAEKEVPGIGRVTDLLPTVEIGISSTDLRARVRLGLPIRYQVPESVEAYVREHRLYI